MRRRGAVVRALLTLFILAGSIQAQQNSAQASKIAEEADIVFRGQVIAVWAEEPRAPGEVGVVRVTFRVEDGIRGTSSGTLLTIQEWNAAADEYRVGETAVMFLHARSEQSGLTSPVGGRAGHRRADEIPPAMLDQLRAARVIPAAEPPAARQPVRTRLPKTSRSGRRVEVAP